MKKLFANDSFFTATTIAGALSLSLYSVYIFGTGKTSNFAIGAVNVVYVCYLVLLFVSYRRHKKNVTKNLTGGILTAMVIDSITSFAAIEIPIERIFVPIYLILTTAILCTHLYISESRHPSPGKVRINQILCVLVAIELFVWSIVLITRYTDVMSKIGCIGSMIGYPCLFASVICIESRLDIYKSDREAAGWTEEKGYPEGYVHEYQKK